MVTLYLALPLKMPSTMTILKILLFCDRHSETLHYKKMRWFVWNWLLKIRYCFLRSAFKQWDNKWRCKKLHLALFNFNSLKVAKKSPYILLQTLESYFFINLSLDWISGRSYLPRINKIWITQKSLWWASKYTAQ